MSSLYRNHVLKNKPLMYYRLGENSGTTAVDEMEVIDGSYLNGPILGEPGLLRSDMDTAVLFDGVNDYMSFGDGGNTRGALAGSSISIAIWVNARSWDTGSKNRIVFYGDAPPHFILTQDTGNINWAHWTGSTLKGDLNAALPPAGTTFFVVGTYDAGTGEWRLFVNGELKTGPIIDSISGYIIDNNVSQLARDQGSSGRWHFDGWMDDFALFDHVINANEIFRLYQLGISTNPRSRYSPIRTRRPTAIAGR